MLIQAENIDLLTLLNPYDLSSARFGADILRQMKSALQSGDTVEYIYKPVYLGEVAGTRQL